MGFEPERDGERFQTIMNDSFNSTGYRVLARKYRPRGFDELIGQETLVRTLSNAIAANRVAHAFVLTGVRGVGKTTTARIIARALNCIGVDGNGGVGRIAGQQWQRPRAALCVPENRQCHRQ